MDTEQSEMLVDAATKGGEYGVVAHDAAVTSAHFVIGAAALSWSFISAFVVAVAKGK